MKRQNHKAAFRFGLGLCIVYGVLVWALFLDQSLPFPLGAEDQGRVMEALGRSSIPTESGWVPELVDRGLALFHPSNPYPLLKHFRILAGVLAVTGLSLWAWRANGWLFGIWVGLLSVGFLPLRIAATSLGPQVVCVAMLVWGGTLSLGRPWSKTGTAEQFGGGALLGGTCFAAPWGFLYGMSIPLRALFSKRYRQRLERPFWIGFVLGLAPGLVWIAGREGPLRVNLGFHPETLGWIKFDQFLELTSPGLGWLVLLAMAGGLYSIARSAKESRGWVTDFVWPAVVSLTLGYTDPLRSSLAFPGAILLTAFGIESAGALFVNKTESRWLSSFLALLLGYIAFFGPAPILRERRAHSLEVEDLASLVSDQVPQGEAIALFRLNSVAEYLRALDPSKSWIIIQKNRLPTSPGDSSGSFWSAQVGDGRSLWVDRKRMSERGEGLGERYWNDWLRSYRPKETLKKGQAELWRFSEDHQSR